MGNYSTKKQTPAFSAQIPLVPPLNSLAPLSATRRRTCQFVTTTGIRRTKSPDISAALLKYTSNS